MYNRVYPPPNFNLRVEPVEDLGVEAYTGGTSVSDSQGHRCKGVVLRSGFAHLCHASRRHPSKKLGHANQSGKRRFGWHWKERITPLRGNPKCGDYLGRTPGAMVQQ